MSKSFYSWLLQFKKENTPVGDLAKEALSDKEFPRHSVCRKHLRDYIERLSACDSAINIFEEAFTHYEKEVKQKS